MLIKAQDKKRIILTILLVGMICIMMVVLTALRRRSVMKTTSWKQRMKHCRVKSTRLV